MAVLQELGFVVIHYVIVVDDLAQGHGHVLLMIVIITCCDLKLAKFDRLLLFVKPEATACECTWHKSILGFWINTIVV